MNGTSVLVIVALLALQGCAAGSIAGAALQMAGIARQPDLPDAQKPARQVHLRLHASPNLNAGSGPQPLALVTRIYKLRQASAFQQMSFDTFLNAQSEQQLLGNDLLEVKEVTLIPGQRYEATEKVTREAYFIGVVALFRTPAENRWRLVFSSADAEKNTITIGLHACAMSTGGAAAKPLATVRCQ